MKSFTRTTVLLTQAQAEGLKRAAENDPVGLRVSQLIRVFIDEGLRRRAAHANALRDRRQQGNGHVAFQNSEPRAAGPAAGWSNGIYSVRAGRLAAAESHPHAHGENSRQRQRHRTWSLSCPPTRGAGDDSERTASQKSQRQMEPRLVPAAERKVGYGGFGERRGRGSHCRSDRSDQAPRGEYFCLVA